MKHSAFFRRSSRHNFRKIELSLHIDVVRALKRLAGEAHLPPKLLCGQALAVYSDTVYHGKGFRQFQDDALRKIGKPDFAPVSGPEELLAEEMAETLKQGENIRTKYRGKHITKAQAHAIIAKERAGQTRWAKLMKKPSPRRA